MQPLWLLRIIALTFLVDSAFGAAGMVRAWLTERPLSWGINIIGLVIAVGLLRRREAARRIRLAAVSVGAAVIAILAIASNIEWVVVRLYNNTVPHRPLSLLVVGALVLGGAVSFLQIAGLRYLRGRMAFDVPRVDDQAAAPS